MVNPKLQFITATKVDKTKILWSVMIYKQNRDHKMLLGKETPTGQRQTRDLFLWSQVPYRIETLKNT